jgi:hypothetical protein
MKKMLLQMTSGFLQLESTINIYTGCLKIREFRIQSVVGDYFSSPNMKVHSLKCVFFKYRLKSSVFIVIYGVDNCGK